MFETYPPLPPSPPVPFSSERSERGPPYIRTSFSSGYVRSKSTQAILSDASPIATSPSAPSLRRHSQSRGHRHTKSLNAQATPPPLPLPKERTDSGYLSNKENSDDQTEAVIRQRRLKRSETDPGLPDKRMDSANSLSSLPENPKLWTPTQLAQYLLTALRFRGNKSAEVVLVPKPVAQDIANFVVKCKLNGRAFLRLEDKDIEQMGVNQLWRTALLSSSLELRKSMLKGRIWGFSPDDVFAASHSTEDRRRVPSTVLEREEVNARELSPVSYAQPAFFGPHDLSTLRSSGYLPQSSSTLSFDSDVPNYTPSRHSTRPRAQSASSNASSSVGRVREIVRNLERAASSSENVTQENEDAGFASGEMTESDEDPELDTVGNIPIICRGPEDRSTNEDTPFQYTPEANLASSTPQSSRTSRASTSEPIKTPPLPSPMNLLTIAWSSDSNPSNLPGQDFSQSKGTRDDEPTIEALLKEGEPCEGRPRATSWGAKAWEGEFPGGTSRRVPAAITPAEGAAPVTNIERSGDETIKVPRTAWDNMCRRLDETERRIALLEIQEVERRKDLEIVGKTSDDHDAPKSGSLSATTLPPYLVIVSVGVCALVAQYVFGRIVGRRPRL